MSEIHMTAMSMREESMELHIEGQHIEVSDDLRTMIADRLEKLNARHGDVIHARVSLVKSNHHQHGSDEAGIIDIGADEDVHFTRQVVMAGAFERLAEGMSVEVDVMEGSEGYEATRVVPL